MASAMSGTPNKPPAWAIEDLRVVSGSSVDVRIVSKGIVSKGRPPPSGQMAQKLAPTQRVCFVHLASAGQQPKIDRHHLTTFGM